jgi:chromate transporter
VLAGALAAAVVTWFTFLPSFLFILLGGPFIESTHGKLKFTAPLTAITAAVVGVILNLALFLPGTRCGRRAGKAASNGRRR